MRRTCGTTIALFGLLSLSAAQAAAVIPLSSLDGANGFRLDGAAANDQSGFSVSAAGDINVDGIDDLIIGAPNQAGSTYVVFGRRMDSFDAVINLSTIDGTNGFRLVGVAGSDSSGYSVSAAGDINGDSVDDIVIGAPNGDPDSQNPEGMHRAGISYVVFGRGIGSFDAVINLSTLDGTTGFRLDGSSPYDKSGRAVSAAGDINGDGIDDLIIGSDTLHIGSTIAHFSYVVFGKTSGFVPVINLGALDGSNFFQLASAAPGDLGARAVSAAGDINGDGVDDLIIGAPYADPNELANAGSSNVVFGRKDGFPASFPLSSLNGSNGFRLDGVVSNQYSGFSVSTAGDFNGDGIDDLIIGASGRGFSYLVFGRRTVGFDAVISLSTLDGSNGFRLDASGSRVSDAGDINGDGINDVIIGAPYADPNGVTDAGSSYVVFGRRGVFAPAISLSLLDGRNGFRLDGVARNDRSGFSVSAAGDVNGDGIDDLIIGAPYAAPNGRTNAGSTYVVFGTSHRIFCDGFESGGCP